MSNATKMVLKYPGAKWRIAKWIIEQMPAHHSYVEPYFGSGAVFFRKSPSKIETINDIDDDVTNLFTIIRDNSKPLIKALTYTPYARAEYNRVFEEQKNNDEIEKARRFLVKCWQGHGFRTSAYRSGWKNDVQGREAAYGLRNWHRLPGWIDDIVERLKEVQIENRPAVEVIRRFNYPNVLIYADPPYVLSTRTGKSYKHEMTDNDHVELLEALIQHKGNAMVSGYDNEMYNKMLHGWSKTKIENLTEKAKKRTEILWTKSKA